MAWERRALVITVEGESEHLSITRLEYQLKAEGGKRSEVGVIHFPKDDSLTRAIRRICQLAESRLADVGDPDAATDPDLLDVRKAFRLEEE